MHDPENVQLSAHLKGFAKILRVLFHRIGVEGTDSKKVILLSLDHIKKDDELKAVPEWAVDQSGILASLIGLAATLCPKFLGSHLSYSLPLWLAGRILRELWST